MGGYIGREPNFQNFARDVFSSDGTVNPLTLTYVPGSALALLVFAGGVYQRPTTDYTTSGNQLTPVVAWAPGVGITVVYLGIAGDVATPANGTINWAQLSAIMQGIVGYTSGRRRTINGAMEIDQANEGSSVTVNSGSLAYSVDMIYGFGTAAAGVFTMQRLSATPPAGFKNYLRAAVGTADASPGAASVYALNWAIEGQNLVDFQLGLATAIQFTVSFWVRSSLTGQFSGCISNGAASRAYPFTFNINAANTWEYKTITIQGDVTGTWAIDNTAGFIFRLDLGAGSTARGTAGAWVASNTQGVTGAVRLISTLSATLDITGLQVEPGATATPYERRMFSDEFARCLRYFEKSYSLGTKPGTVTTTGQFAGFTIDTATLYCNGRTAFTVRKRVASTVTLYSPNSGASGKVYDGSSSTDGTPGIVMNTESTFGFNGPGQWTGVNNNVFWHFASDARL